MTSCHIGCSAVWQQAWVLACTINLVWLPMSFNRVGVTGAGVAAGFNAPISGVFFAVETVLQRQLLDGKESDRPRGRGNIGDPSGGTSSGLTVAMVLLANVLAAVGSQVGGSCVAPCTSKHAACE